MSTQNYKIGDCKDLMQKYPDNHFDLILTDPPYGIGESNEKNSTRSKLAKTTNYNHYDWDQKRIPKEYFTEMFRVSKNQIIFGGQLLYRLFTSDSMLDCLGQTEWQQRFCRL